MNSINAFETFHLFSSIAAAIFIEAMPFLVIGALFSAVIEVFVSTERLMRHIPKSTAGRLVFGIGSGFVLPTCECGVVPIVRRLMRKGVPPFMAIAYMIAAPIVNPVVLASTYIAFRGSFAMVFARIAVAAMAATMLGLYAMRLHDVFLNTKKTEHRDPICHHHHCEEPFHRKVQSEHHDPKCHHDHSGEAFIGKAKSVMTHGAHEFMDMGKFLIAGALAAAAFKTLLPENIMSFFSRNLELSIIGMMALAILLSICSEVDAFVAASFQVFPAASKLAFVGVGPMVDLKLIGMYAVTFNRRMLLALVVGPVVMVFLLSWLFGQTGG